MTVTGDISEPKNIWVRTGTLYSDCVAFCGGIPSDSVKTGLRLVVLDTDIKTVETEQSGENVGSVQNVFGMLDKQAAVARYERLALCGID